MSRLQTGALWLKLAGVIILLNFSVLYAQTGKAGKVLDKVKQGAPVKGGVTGKADSTAKKTWNKVKEKTKGQGSAVTAPVGEAKKVWSKLKTEAKGKGKLLANPDSAAQKTWNKVKGELKSQLPGVTLPEASWAGFKKQFLKYVNTHGTASLTGQYSNRPAAAYNSTLPPSFLRFQLSSSTSFFDIPLSIQAYATTEQTPLRQNMNYIRVNFDQSKLWSTLKEKGQKRLQDLKAQAQAKADSLLNAYEDKLTKKFNPDSLKNLKDKNWKDELAEMKGKIPTDKLKDLSSWKDSLNIKQLQVKDLDLKSEKLGLLTDSLSTKFEEYKRFTNPKNFSNYDSLLTITEKLKIKHLSDSLTKIRQLSNKKLTPDELKKAIADSLKIRTIVLKNKSKADSLWRKTKDVISANDSLLNAKDKLQAGVTKLSNTLSDSLQKLNLDSYKSRLKELKDVEKIDSSLKELKDAKNYGQLKNHPQLQKFGFMRKIDKYLSYVTNFNIGTSFPIFNQLAVNGAPITGVSAELDIKKIHVAVAASKNLKGIMNGNNTFSQSRLSQTPYNRTLVATELGYGKQDSNHVHLVAMWGRDKATGQMDSAQADMPRENLLLGLDAKYLIKPINLQIESELHATMLQTNILAKRINTSEMAWWLNKPVNRSRNAYTDFAAFLKCQWTGKENTKIIAQYRRVGSGYHSFGSPFQRNDVEGVMLEIAQPFWKKRLDISVGGLFEHNNLNNWISDNLKTYSGNAAVRLNIPKLPTFYYNYLFMHFDQKPDFGQTGQLHTHTTGLTYAVEIKKTRLNSALSAQYQYKISLNDTGTFKAWNLTFNQVVEFQKPFVLTAIAAITQQTRKYFDVKTYGVGLTGQYTAFKCWKHILGGMYELNETRLERKTAFYENSYRFKKWFEVKTRIEYTHLVTLSYPYSYFTATSGITFFW